MWGTAAFYGAGFAYLHTTPQIYFAKLLTKLCHADKNALYSYCYWTSFGLKTDIGRGSLRKMVSHMLKRLFASLYFAAEKLY